MSRLRYAAIWLLDALDAHVLRHSLHRYGLCDFIAWHPWWGDDHFDKAARASGWRTR